MTHLLHIQSSPNLGASVSRQLSEEFVAAYRNGHPGTTVTVRDLGLDPVPHLGVDLLGGLYGAPESLTPAQAAALKTSDNLIAELMAADVIAIGAPMYNFSVPSALKAWIDHVLRAGKTFQYTAEGPKGLVHGKKAFLFLATGGVYSNGPYKAFDFQENFLRSVLGFIGITDVTVVRAEGLALGEEAKAKALAEASALTEKLAA
jgi:FMN-dependent NADH-azoreductase